MVDPLVGTLALLLVALLGARVSFSSEQVPPGPRLLFRTGTHFLLLGFLVGPSALGLLAEGATDQLFPFLALGLGWVGFHFGLQLDFGSLRQFPASHHAFAFGQAIATWLFFLGAGYGALRWLELTGRVPMLLLLVAASTAAVTTPAGIAMVSQNYFVKGRVRDLTFLAGSLDAVVGIACLQFAYAFLPHAAVGEGLAVGSQLFLMVAAVGLGVVCGIVFLWLVRERPAPEGMGSVSSGCQWSRESRARSSVLSGAAWNS